MYQSNNKNCKPFKVTRCKIRCRFDREFVLVFLISGLALVNSSFNPASLNMSGGLLTMFVLL